MTTSTTTALTFAHVVVGAIVTFVVASVVATHTALLQPLYLTISSTTNPIYISTFAITATTIYALHRFRNI